MDFALQSTSDGANMITRPPRIVLPIFANNAIILNMTQQTDPTQTLGAFIRERRLALGMTQRKLADAVGFASAATVSDIESGFRNPDQQLLPAFAAALKIDLPELEKRDARVQIRETKDLIRRQPEFAAAFRKVLKGAQRLSADELARRIDQALKEPADDSGNTTNTDNKGETP